MPSGNTVDIHFLLNLKPFLRRTLLDHFVVGDVDPAKITEGDQFETVGGRNVTFTSGDGGPGRMKLRWVMFICLLCAFHPT